MKRIGFSGRQSPFWAPESPACRATGTGPPPPPPPPGHPTHAHAHAHAQQAQARPRRGGLRASFRRPDGRADSGHSCGCSHFHTVLLGPLLPALSHLPELSSPLFQQSNNIQQALNRLLGGLRVIIIDEGVPRLPKGSSPGRAAAVSCAPLPPSELLGTCTPWLLPGPSHPMLHAGASLPSRRETPPIYTQPTAARPCPPLQS